MGRFRKIGVKVMEFIYVSATISRNNLRGIILVVRSQHSWWCCSVANFYGLIGLMLHRVEAPPFHGHFRI
jgi:hypothetical protein